MVATTHPDRPPTIPFVELVGVSKTYGATRAVRDVSMVLASRGEIHALVGENGAGKSTCIGIASGRVIPTAGSVVIGGTTVTPGSPRSAREAGLHAIYQELTIVPALSPAANVFLGRTLSRAGWLKDSEMESQYRALCERLHVRPADTRRSGDLSIAEQQLLEVARALISDAAAILFDEPTASLAQAERDALFHTMHRLRAEGIAMALVTHNLDDVLEHSDVVTVFRDGQTVERRPTGDWTKREMVSAMLGASAAVSALSEPRRQRTTVTAVAGPPALSVAHLSSPGLIDDISFELGAGEILGIAGLVGSGRSSILRALAGLDPKATGTVSTAGAVDETAPPKTVRAARRRGIALLPEDRKGTGLMLSRSGTENVTLGEWQGLGNLGFLRAGTVRSAARTAAVPVGFDAARLDERTEHLSGGNQQKIMLARWLHTTHSVLLADEPTRGVDVGAKAEILASLERMVAQRRSVILVSSELEEVVNLSDRVLVIHNGTLQATLDGALEDISVARILAIIFAASTEQDEERRPA